MLVGHSMGGLVTRSACYYGEQQHRWTEAVRHVVCLGSPHLGTHLEKGVHIASWALARLPETRAVAGRSSAISSALRAGRSSTHPFRVVNVSPANMKKVGTSRWCQLTAIHPCSNSCANIRG